MDAPDPSYHYCYICGAERAKGGFSELYPRGRLRGQQKIEKRNLISYRCKKCVADYEHEHGIKFDPVIDYPKWMKGMLSEIAVKKAIREGVLTRAAEQQCVNCGQQADHLHHYAGYNQDAWLKVVPLCHECHVLEHRFMRAEAKSNS
jgi:hypothetical protein